MVSRTNEQETVKRAAKSSLLDGQFAERLWHTYCENSGHSFFREANHYLAREISEFKTLGYGSRIPDKERINVAIGITIAQNRERFPDEVVKEHEIVGQFNPTEFTARFVCLQLDEMRRLICSERQVKDYLDAKDASGTLAKRLMIPGAVKLVLLGFSALLLLGFVVSAKRAACRMVDEDVIKSIVDPRSAFEKTSDKYWPIVDEEKITWRPFLIMCLLIALGLGMLILTLISISYFVNFITS